jgi:hypothetical protein
MNLHQRFEGLTWRGRLEHVYYLLRRHIIAPAPDSDRCCMGWPIGPDDQCPRYAEPSSLWCRHHERQIRHNDITGHMDGGGPGAAPGPIDDS